MSDPRVYFASERTLLAWVRTGIAVIGLGFVVARFGVFMELMRVSAAAGGPATSPLASTVLGVLLVLSGSAAMMGASHQHRAFTATLPLQDLPARYHRGFAPVLAWSIALLGVLLALYLAL